MTLSQKAAALGTAAFAAGKKRVPASDSALRILIGAHDGHAMEIMTAWTRAWDAANLAAPV